MSPSRFRWALAIAVLIGVATGPLARAQEQALTDEAKREFLLNANIIKSAPIQIGITRPWRLTLSDGKITHDAAFQAVEEYQAVRQSAIGRIEKDFRDSFHFNIAAYEISRLLGLDYMTPVTVERKWNGKTGALAWWIPFKWHEFDRIKLKLQPPDPEAWNRQMQRARVFAQLVGDTDRNFHNLLISEDWKLFMIDFTRAFRPHHELEKPGSLVRCDQQLLERLRQLTEADLERVTRPHLSAREVKAVLARRGAIVALFDQLIAEKGANEVLY